MKSKRYDNDKKQKLPIKNGGNLVMASTETKIRTQEYIKLQKNNSYQKHKEISRFIFGYLQNKGVISKKGTHPDEILEKILRAKD